ncbi:MAG: VWA domain-containing protein [Microbacteriaceae bacterium]
MDLANVWVFWVAGLLLLAVVAFLLIFRWLRKKTTLGSHAPVTNSYRLTDLPAYRTRVNKYRVFLSGALLLVFTTIAALSFLAARPVQSTLYSPDKFNRDIVLCLDISGSMVDYDEVLLGKFIEMVNQFEGERIGLVLWNSSAVQIFPLTDDYEFVKEQMKLVKDSFTNYGANTDYLYWIGTDLGEGSSLIGDGLASCVLRFDMVDKERSRSIIFATDNYLAGEPILELSEASALAQAAGVTVYGIEAGFYEGSPESKEYQDLMKLNGHRHFAMTNFGLVNEIVTRIQSDQAKGYKAPAQWIYHDDPLPWILLFTGAFGAYLALVWRVKL